MAKVIATKTRFAPIYITKDGKQKVNLPTCSTCNQSGVYFIKSNRTGEIVYIGFSGSNLYKTITRHFQTWNDFFQLRKVYSKNNYTIRVIFTHPKRAAILEQYLINKYKPRDNKLIKEYLTPQEEKAARETLAAAQWQSKLDAVKFVEVPF